MRSRRLAPALLAVAALAAGDCGAPRDRARSSAERIIAVAPSAVEMLYALGLGDRVVAVGDFVRWPPAALEKQRIGGLMDPRLETIATLEPDLAILVASESTLAAELERLGIEVLTVPSESLADVERGIAAIAARTGVVERGDRLVTDLRMALAPRPVAGGRRVLLVVGRQPGDLSDLYAAAAGTFLDELVGRLGGVNVLADAAARYPRVGLEEILLRRPEIVVELAAEELAPAAEDTLRADWRREVPGSPPCVAVVAGDHVLVPGPRLASLYEELAAAIESCGT